MACSPCSIREALWSSIPQDVLAWFLPEWPGEQWDCTVDTACSQQWQPPLLPCPLWIVQLPWAESTAAVTGSYGGCPRERLFRLVSQVGLGFLRPTFRHCCCAQNYLSAAIQPCRCPKSLDSNSSAIKVPCLSASGHAQSHLSHDTTKEHGAKPIPTCQQHTQTRHSSAYLTCGALFRKYIWSTSTPPKKELGELGANTPNSPVFSACTQEVGDPVSNSPAVWFRVETWTPLCQVSAITAGLQSGSLWFNDLF